MQKRVQRFIYAVQHANASRVLLWIEWAVLSVVLATYMYFIVASVVQVVLRQELLVEVGEQETRVSELESRYFARLNSLRPETVSEYGLVAIEPTTYVTVDAGDRLTRRP